jgi:energy-converting hydrogenase A subunit M
MGGFMTDESLKKIKIWELESYYYQKDVVKPLAKILNLSIDDMTDLIANNLDMARIESSHSSVEQVKHFILEKHIDLDLGLDYFHNLELLNDDQINLIKKEIMNELEISGILAIKSESKEYKELIEKGKEKILNILRGE